MIDSMDLSQESQALPTESSNQPPPIPPIPPIPNSLSPLASPPPPLNLEPVAKTKDGRQILKPVAPSKRPMPKSLQHNSRNKSDIANAFLPQELAEIIATRQRCERAWHARIMICTTVISSMDSTLANFAEEVEKEEVEKFKAYLKLAIANFAANDSSPPPPRVPLHSKPNKGNGNRNGKGKDKDKNLSNRNVAISHIASNQGSTLGMSKKFELPKIIQDKEKTWATIARKGHKKALVAQSINIQTVVKNKESQKVSQKNNSAVSLSDKRLFIRLPQDHEWRNLSPAGIREVIVKKLQISPSLIGKIKPVHSGFALSPCTNEARETILAAGNGLFLSGAKLEQATNWVPILIPTVPSTIRMEQGQVEVEKSMLADEIERVCSIRPAHLKLYGRNNTDAPHRTWMAYFTKAPRSGFRAFDESGIARPFKKQQPIEFCKRCNSHQPA